MDIFGVIVGVVMLAVLAIGGERQRNRERVMWNNGVCEESGQPWVCFDLDSHGGRMYRDEDGNYCDISYAVDKILKTG
jgi:hypothetical protein